MTKEEKELLLKDLCARLPYGIITKNCKNNFDVPVYLLPDINGIKRLIDEYELKPYLRTMSSMTEDEKSELWFLLSEGRTNIELNSNGQLTTRDVIELGFNYPCVCPQISSQYVDWLNAHHFDYRGLIEKGLALQAPEEMYNIK